MSPKVMQKIERMGKIFDEMERLKIDDPEYFDDIFEQSSKDLGIATAFYYLCVEQKLEEDGLIKTQV